jgi:hypothetical protein
METNHDDSEIIEVIDTVRPSELPSCDESENEEEMDFDGVDLHGLLECFFTEGKKGRNITEVLCEIKRQFEVHNKLLLKLYQHLENK